jgi:hypothetical protein
VPDDFYHLVLDASNPLEPPVIQHLSALFELSAYDLRLRMRGGLPRSVVRANDLAHVRSMVPHVCRFGVTSIVYREAGLPPCLPVLARTLRVENRLVRIRQKLGSGFELAIERLTLRIVGRRERRESYGEFDDDVGISRRNPAARLEYVKRYRNDVSTVALLFSGNPAEPAVVIDPEMLAFAALFDHPAATDELNMQRLLADLDVQLGSVPVDRRLMAAGRASANLFFDRRSGFSDFLANAYLVFYSHLARTRPGFHLDLCAEVERK